MKEKVLLNYHLLDWLTSIVKDGIESAIDEEPDKMRTFLAVNKMLNELDNQTAMRNLSEIITDYMMDDMIREIKESI